MHRVFCHTLIDLKQHSHSLTSEGFKRAVCYQISNLIIFFLGKMSGKYFVL